GNRYSERGPPGMTTAISMKSVCFAYKKDVPVLEQASLEVQYGQVMGFLGSNGAGKTTTFRLLAGLLLPQAGEIFVAGHSVALERIEARQQAAYIPDEPILYPRLSALENLNMFGLLWGIDPVLVRSRAQELLQEVGLWEVRNDWVESY